MKKLFFTTLLTLASTALVAQTLPYQNPQLPAAQRAHDLLSRLTLEEKVSLMMDSHPSSWHSTVPMVERSPARCWA